MPRRDISVFNRNDQHFTPFIDGQLEGLVNRVLEEMNDPVLSRYTAVGREFLLYGLIAATRKRIVVYDGDDYTVWPAAEPKVYKTEDGKLAVSNSQRNVFVRSVNPEGNQFSLVYTLEHRRRYEPGEVEVPRQGNNERFATAYLERLFQATQRFSEEAASYPLRPVEKPTVLIENILLIPGRKDITYYLENCTGRIRAPSRPARPKLRLVHG